MAANGRVETRDEERRNRQRVDILGTLRAAVLIAEPLTVTDLSAAGLQAISTFPFQLDALHEFRLTLDDRVVVVKGRIVHSTVADLDAEGVEYRTGVDFVDLSEGARCELEAYAERLRQSRAGVRPISG